MKQLIYTSQTASDVDKKKLLEILTISKASNIEKGLAGLLIFDGNYFLACLEGEAAVIDEIIHKISKDPRNNNLTVIGEQKISYREFNTWNMGFANHTWNLQQTILKTTGQLDFDPFKLHYLKAKKLLLELEPLI